jgi:hypothetical protein
MSVLQLKLEHDAEKRQRLSDDIML